MSDIIKKVFTVKISYTSYDKIISRPIDAAMVKDAIEGYLDSVSGFYYKEVNVSD